MFWTLNNFLVIFCLQESLKVQTPRGISRLEPRWAGELSHLLLSMELEAVPQEFREASKINLYEKKFNRQPGSWQEYF